MASEPLRQPPGFYFQTPAFQRHGGQQPGQPMRQPAFNTPAQNATPTNGQQQSVANPAQDTPDQQLQPIERAARTIADRLEMDTRFPALEGYIGQSFSADGYDVPTTEASKPFQRVNQYPIPDRIFDQINQAQISYQMGLFAELNHAWITIDNCLYLWDYTDPNPDIKGYEDQQAYGITQVKLVKPRLGVFVAAVTHLLVVSTAAEIHLVGVSTKRSAEGYVTELQLYETKMHISIKGIHVTCIEGSANTGRIFFGGRGSTDVYELTYQQEEKWFSNKCSKICHTNKGIASILPALPFAGNATQEYVSQMVVDDTRHLLYVLSSRSTIKVYHLKSANNLPFVLDRTFGQLRTMISHNMISHNSAGPSQLLQPSTYIVSISPISGNEASRLSLLATTNTGIRIYLSATSQGYYERYSSIAPPTSMQVLHVRFPPSLSLPQQPIGQPASSQALTYRQGPGQDVNSIAFLPLYSAIRYAPGYFICVRKGQDPSGNQDQLFVIAPDTGRIAQAMLDPAQGGRFLETVWSQPLDGPVQEEQGIGLASQPFAAAATPQGFGNELAVQYDRAPGQFAILTSRGIHIIRRRRAADVFADSVRSIAEEPFDEAVKKFIKSYGRVETCATALAVACCEATSVTADARITNITDRDVVESAARVFKEHGGKPTLDENAVIENGASIDNVRLSPRHDGLATYISRLVRSLWRSPIIRADTRPVGGLTASPGIALDKLRNIQQSVERLQKFLVANKTTIDGLSGPDHTSTRTHPRNDELAQQAEHRAMNSLLKLINNIIEGIAFVLVLFEERVEEIILSFPEESLTRKRITQLTFEALFCSFEGKELARELVKAIVNLNIANGSNVETVASALQRKCGSFCSSDDVIIFKAQEMLRKAAGAGVNSESARMQLNESMKLFGQVAKSLPIDYLQNAVEQYVDMEFYGGAIRLVLQVAQEQDRGNRALSWIKDGMPRNDAREDAFHARTRCYQLIHAIVKAVDQATAQADVAGDPTSRHATRRLEAYNEINSSTDEVFQTHLYNWYLSQGWSDRLLEITSPFVVTYLERKSEEDPAHADLLWRYYAHYQYYLDAAKVQLMLAKSGFDIKLDKRIEYLSRARTNASTRATAIGHVGKSRQNRQELLREVSDLLDLANIQGELLSRLRGDSRLTDERKAAITDELGGQIRDLDDIYGNYADQAGYHDLCLLIYQAADHRETPNVVSTWRDLIQQRHADAQAGGLQPYVYVSDTIKDVARRLNLSEAFFPIPQLLPILLTYHYTSTPTAPATWVLDLLYTDLSVPPENLLLSLENMFYTADTPFNDRGGRRFLGSQVVHLVDRWYVDSGRAGGDPLGGEENALGVSETLKNIIESKYLDAQETDRARLLREDIEKRI